MFRGSPSSIEIPKTAKMLSDFMEYCKDKL